METRDLSDWQPSALGSKPIVIPEPCAVFPRNGMTVRRKRA